MPRPSSVITAKSEEMDGRTVNRNGFHGCRPRSASCRRSAISCYNASNTISLTSAKKTLVGQLFSPRPVDVAAARACCRMMPLRGGIFFDLTIIFIAFCARLTWPTDKFDGINPHANSSAFINRPARRSLADKTGGPCSCH